MIFTMIMVFGIYLNPGLITHMEDKKQGCSIEFLAQSSYPDHIFYGHTCAEVHAEIAKQMGEL